MARKTLTDKGVAALKPRAQRYAHPDPELRGHYVRVMPSGQKSFVTVARNRKGTQVWSLVGPADAMDIEAAREQARTMLQRVRAGLPAREPRAETFGAVAESWRKRHVEKNELRTADEIIRLLDRYVLPTWRDREIATIRRSDITALLDQIEDKHGGRQADYCLAVVRAVMNWHATRHDDYGPPIVHGMRRQSPKTQARSRVLTDDELRAIWQAAETAGAYGDAVRLCLLTAQRRNKVIRMRWAELSDAGEWNIPKAPREKDNAGVLVLPEQALAIIRARPRFADNPYVFAGRVGAINGLSKFKARLDKAAGVTGWRVHDLRRTARSLMSRAGVSSEHAERVMGHAIGGVEGVYDRHSYKGEKADALARLAALIEGIVHPRDNVMVMERARR